MKTVNINKTKTQLVKTTSSLFFICLFVFHVHSFTQTVVSGNVTGIWQLNGSPYIVTGNVSIVDSLVIKPGVHVQFQAGGWMIQASSNVKFKAIGTVQAPIIFEPFQGNTPGSWNCIYLINSGNDDVLRNCKIQNGTNGISVNNSNPTIDSCEIYGNSQNGIYMYYELSTDSIMISDCRIHDNGASGIQFWGFGKNGSAYVYGDIYRSIFYNNVESGIDVCTETYWNWDYALAQLTITNSTVTGNKCGIRANTNRGNGDAIIINTIVAFNYEYGVKNQGPGSIIGQNDIIYSCFWSNNSGNFSGLVNPVSGFGEPIKLNYNNDSCDINFNIFFDPLFEDMELHNYCFLPGSSCINAGTQVILGGIHMDPDGSYPEIGECYAVNVGIHENSATTNGNIAYSLKNYPNPFEYSTTISYSVISSSHTEIAILDLAGRLIKIFKNDIKETGDHSIVWNGEDAYGKQCDKGIYVCRIITTTGVQSIKMIRL
jgi:parallel beta-helix repeat protein